MTYLGSKSNLDLLSGEWRWNPRRSDQGGIDDLDAQEINQASYLKRPSSLFLSTI